jgi:hypothetical protein
MIPERIRATTTAAVAHPGSGSIKERELSKYFEYSRTGIDVEEDGLKEISFGEYLVESNVLDRYQLFRALQMQDQHPGVRIGEAAAALGYIAVGDVERLYAKFNAVSAVTVD